MRVGDVCCYGCCFFFQAEDGIRDLVRSRGLGDVYKRQVMSIAIASLTQLPRQALRARNYRLSKCYAEGI